MKKIILLSILTLSLSSCETSVEVEKIGGEWLMEGSRLGKGYMIGDQKDTDLAIEIIDYLKGLSFKAIERELTDFERNVLKLVTSQNIQKDQIGISASLPKVYLNKLEQDRWTDRENVLSRTSEKIGTLHQRETFDAIIEFSRFIPRTMSYIVTCSVDDKHILKFFHDKKLDIGTTVNVTGFVKSQNKGKFHNGFETIINRIKINN